METNIATPNTSNNGKIMAGIIIVIIGLMLLADQLNLFFIPGWLYSWPMWMIAYGIYMGGKYNFKKPFYIWVIAIGTAFLFTENINDADKVVWPLAIIGVGTWMVMKHNNKPVHTEYSGSSYKEL
jgi:hypothetical protein